MNLKPFLASLLVCRIAVLSAGTLVYKTGGKEEEHTVSKITIISIDKKLITVKHNDGIRTIPLNNVVSYYDTDISSGGEFADNTCDYSISIRKLEMPETGYTIKREKSRKYKKVSNCEIEFSITKKYEKGKSNSVRMPYFYLFVLTTSTEAYGRRPIYTYCYPDEAKISSKTYDEAKILEAVTAMKRSRIYYNSRSDFGANGKLSLSGDYKPIEISLKGIRDRRIIAYHLDVWGKNKIIATKDWRDIRYTVGRDWWKRY
ncbi:MAG: hypothetical protein PHH77_03930 [Victivallaceae bacterium]|nr:hypothetical protein [Victivallaceae bacterium]